MEALSALLAIPYGDATVYHIAVEIVLALVVIKLVFFPKRSYAIEPRKKLSKEDEEELLREWTPEPLVKGRTEEYTQPPVVESIGGTVLTIGGKEKINLGTFDFLGFVEDGAIKSHAAKAISKYGVGSCGPRGFYGTVDVHLDLEEALARFLSVEEVIIYSYGFSTVASAIPAYSKRGDVIFYDEKISFATQRGLIASRSKLVMFKHNDMADLERLLQVQAAEDKKNSKKAMATRRFLVAEGLYANTGNIAPLKQLVELKYKYKVRLILEESFSFGMLGRTGRGLTEHLGVAVDDVDIIVGSMETSLGSIGGFCAGRTYVIDHQRLSGQGYCFSASLPPLLAIAASDALARLACEPELLSALQRNVTMLRGLLNSLPGLRVAGDAVSPLIHLFLAKPQATTEAEHTLQRVVDRCIDGGVAVTRARYVRMEEMHSPEPSIRLTVTARHTEAQLRQAAAAIRAAAKAVLA